MQSFQLNQTQTSIGPDYNVIFLSAVLLFTNLLISATKTVDSDEDRLWNNSFQTDKIMTSVILSEMMLFFLVHIYMCSGEILFIKVVQLSEMLKHW